MGVLKWLHNLYMRREGKNLISLVDRRKEESIELIETVANHLEILDSELGRVTGFVSGLFPLERR